MKQMIIVMNGYSKSGKTTLVNKILKKFPKKFVSIDSAKIHDFLNQNYPVFQDDWSVSGEAYNLRDKATKAIQETLQNTLIKEGISYIDNSCNSTVEKRKKIIDKAKSLNSNIVTVIICVQISEKKLLQRLKALDDETASRGSKRVWVELYEKVQKPAMKVPTPKEADYVLFYSGANSGEIIEKIKICLL